MQADVSINHRVAERLVGGISGHPGLGPVAGEVERYREGTQSDERRLQERENLGLIRQR